MNTILSELYTVTIIRYDDGKPFIDRFKDTFVSPDAAKGFANKHADDLIRTYHNSSTAKHPIQDVKKVEPESGFPITVILNGKPIAEYHVDHYPVYDPTAIAKVTKLTTPTSLLRCSVYLCSGETIEVLYHCDEYNEWTFFYEDGKKPNNPDFETNLIRRLQQEETK